MQFRYELLIFLMNSSQFLMDFKLKAAKRFCRKARQEGVSAEAQTRGNRDGITGLWLKVTQTQRLKRAQ